MSKLLSIHLMDGQHERMKRLKREKESLSALIGRALDALEAWGDAPQGADAATLENRLKALELSVDVIIERRIEGNEARLKALEERAFADMFRDMAQDETPDANPEELSNAPQIPTQDATQGPSMM